MVVETCNSSGGPCGDSLLCASETHISGGPSDEGTDDDIWLRVYWLHTAGEPCDGGGGDVSLCGTINGLGDIIPPFPEASKHVNLYCFSIGSDTVSV